VHIGLLRHRRARSIRGGCLRVLLGGDAGTGGAGDISWHGDVDVVVGVVPLNCEATV
jgi:hypothetical protein